MTTFEIAALAILSIALAAYVPLILWAERRRDLRMRELGRLVGRALAAKPCPRTGPDLSVIDDETA